MPATHYYANKILNHTIGHEAWVMPSELYLGLFSTGITAPGVGTELIGNGYTRIETDENDWSVSSLGQVINENGFVFGPATSDWVKPFSIALIGASNNILLYERITSAPIRVNSGGTLSFQPNELIFSIV